MSTRLMLPGLLLALSVGCGGAAGDAAVEASSTPHHAGESASVELPSPLQFEPGRNFTTELEDFQRMVRETHGDPATVRKWLKVAPSKQFSYTTVSGSEMFGSEYQLQGPKPEAPFFEAFAAAYPGQSFYVFYEKSWFRWRAVDSGFHESGMFGETVAAP